MGRGSTLVRVKGVRGHRTRCASWAGAISNVVKEQFQLNGSSWRSVPLLSDADVPQAQLSGSGQHGRDRVGGVWIALPICGRMDVEVPHRCIGKTGHLLQTVALDHRGLSKRLTVSSCPLLSSVARRGCLARRCCGRPWHRQSSMAGQQAKPSPVISSGAPLRSGPSTLANRGVVWRTFVGT
jgi:hypothetical protein